MTNFRTQPPKIDSDRFPAASACYKFIYAYSRDNWSFPTTQEIADHTGTSIQNIGKILLSLEKMGQITRKGSSNWQLVARTLK